MKVNTALIYLCSVLSMGMCMYTRALSLKPAVRARPMKMSVHERWSLEEYSHVASNLYSNLPGIPEWRSMKPADIYDIWCQTVRSTIAAPYAAGLITWQLISRLQIVEAAVMVAFLAIFVAAHWMCAVTATLQLPVTELNTLKRKYQIEAAAVPSRITMKMFSESPKEVLLFLHYPMYKPTLAESPLSVETSKYLYSVYESNDSHACMRRVFMDLQSDFKTLSVEERLAIPQDHLFASVAIGMEWVSGYFHGPYKQHELRAIIRKIRTNERFDESGKELANHEVVVEFYEASQSMRSYMDQKLINQYVDVYHRLFFIDSDATHHSKE